MAACATGASVKTGVDPATQIQIDRWAWETITGQTFPWWDIFQSLKVTEAIKVSDLCALNPDDPPLPSVLTLAAALKKDPFSIKAVADWVLGKWRYALFTNYCTCNTTSSSNCTFFIPLTTGNWTHTLAGSNYFLGNRFHTGSSTCWLSGWNWHPDDQSEPREFRLYRVSDRALIGSWTMSRSGTYTNGLPYFNISPAIALPAATSYTMTFKLDSGKHFMDNGIVSGANSHGNLDQKEWIDLANNTWSFENGKQCWTDPILCDVPGGVPYVPGPPDQPAQPPTLVVPPSWSCSTIPDLCTKLNQIYEYLTWLRGDVQLIQRQSVPYAFISGTTHNVSGSGEFTVQGIPALSVDLSNLPSYIGSSPTYPATLYQVGTLAFGNASGFETRHNLSHDPEVVNVPSWATRVGYEFPSPITAAITELLREP